MSRTIVLERYCYSETETEGRIVIDDERYYSLERPWVDGVPGGVPYQSCVPDGEYELIPHERQNGDRVFALWNPDCHVYYTEDERGDKPGRFLILIHAGNFVEDIVGCIAPGLTRTIYENRRMVTSSRQVMRRIMETKWDTIRIVPAMGARNV